MKRILAFLLSAIMVIVCCPVVYASDYLQKQGDYYLISDSDDLFMFAQLVNSGENSVNAKLTNDIIVNTNVLDSDGNLNTGEFIEWYPIGDKNTYARIAKLAYNGIFDGCHYEISGLYYNSTDNYRDDSAIGLFGTIGTGTVKNVNIKDSYINGYYHIGTISGTVEQGTIQNCSVDSTVVGTSNVGGIVGCGDSHGVTIRHCDFYGIANGHTRVAGICAEFCCGTIEYCTNYGNINGTNSVIAGVAGGVGDYDYDTYVYGCSNYGNISAHSDRYNYTGGVVAFATNTTLSDCLNVGVIDSISDNSFVYVGGICGYGTGNFSNCLNIANISATYSNAKSGVGSVMGSATNNTKYTTDFANNYYLSGTSEYSIAQYGDITNIQQRQGEFAMVSTEELSNLTVYQLLVNGNTNSPWYQALGTNDYPIIKVAPVYDINALGGSIRVMDAGLRFGFAFYDTQCESVQEYGFVYSYSALDDFDINTTGIKQKIANNRIDYGDYTTFNLVFTGMPSSAYDQIISARAYVKIDGEYYYSPILQRSFNGVAQAVLADDTVDQATKTVIENMLSKDV